MHDMLDRSCCGAEGAFSVGTGVVGKMHHERWERC